MRGSFELGRRTLLATGLAAGGTLLGGASADELPWRLPPLKTVEVGGRSIAYYERGSGPPLVLLHGMSGSAAFEWGRVIGPLSARHRVIAPYQIGFGPSAQPDIAYDPPVFVDCLAGLIRALGMETATLVGESFGGWVAASYACAQAERTGAEVLPPIARLVIVDGPVGIRPTDRVHLDAESVNDPAVRAQIHAFFATQPNVDNSMVRTRATREASANMVASARLAKVRLPTLLMWGEQDQLLDVSLGRRLAAELPGASLAVVPDCGHIPSVERPATFLRELSRFEAD
jgi:2-hydroxy-6-oxonona-2,4-dienedioate hydrolase